MATEIGRGVIPVTLDANAIGSSLSSLHALVRTKMSAMGLVGGGALALGIGAAVAGGVGLVKIGKTFEDLEKTIIKTTGASGKALKGLEDSAKRVGAKSPAAWEDIATAIAGVNQRLGLTGRPLENVTRRIIILSRLTGTDLTSNIKSVTRLFNDWQVPTKHQALALDKLYRASQLTGVGVDTLSQSMVTFGAPLRSLGLSFDTSTALLSQFEKEGVNVRAVMPGLKKGLVSLVKSHDQLAPAQAAVKVASKGLGAALKEFGHGSAEASVALGKLGEAKTNLDFVKIAAGKSLPKALEAGMKAIKNAGSTVEANALSFKLFGARAGPDLATAIREGRFAIGPLMKEIKNSKGTLDDSAKRATTFGAQWEILKHKLEIPFSGAGKGFLEKLTEGMVFINAHIGPVIKDISDAFRSDFLPAFRQIMPVVGPVLKFIGGVLLDAIVGLIKGVFQAFKGLVNIIVGIVKLVKAVFTGDWKGAWEALKQIATGALDLIIGAFKIWWNAGILGIFKKGVLKLLSGWKGLWTFFKELPKKTWDLITRIFKGAVEGIGKLVIGAVKLYIKFWTSLFKGIVTLAVHGWKIFRSVWGGALKAVESVFFEAMSMIGRRFMATWEFLRMIGGKVISFFKDNFVRGFDVAKNAVIKFWNSIKSAAEHPVQFVIDTVWNNGLRKVINLIPGVPDLPAVSAHFAKGGPVMGGAVGRDSVPAMLMPGEHVLTTEEVKRLGGQKRVLAMRHAIATGEFGRLGDLPHFAKGGALSTAAVLRAQTFARNMVGRPYVWGGVGPGGFDCSGFMSAITNVLRGQFPYSRVGSTATFPWAGFLPGPGQFTIGSTANAGGGVGHMAGTLSGMNVESSGGVGVHIGSSARGAQDGLFNTQAHLGAAGNFGSGMADVMAKVKDLYSKVAGWLKELASMGGWGGLVKTMVSTTMGSVKGWFADKLGGTLKKGASLGVFGLGGVLASHLFDNGGMLGSGGVGLNRSGRPEAVLDPDQTVAFQTLAAALVRAPRLSAAGRAHATDGEYRMRITNWDEGEGFIRWVASDEIDADGEFHGTKGRMGGKAA